MNDKQMSQLMQHLANNLVADGTDLWPDLQKRLILSKKDPLKKEDSMKTTTQATKALRASAITLLTLAILAGLLFFTPQGKVFAQEAVQFFTHASSDTLPPQAALPTPATSATTTPDPADVLDAHSTIAEVEQQAGFKVLRPTSIPDILTFSGASFDPAKNMTRLFYQSVETNGVVIAQEPVQITDDCDLCGEVGATAAIEEVTIGDVKGQYVVGVWKLTDGATTWDPEPYLQTMRWQKDGMAFELLYMGDPDALKKADLISIAEGLQ